MRSSFCRRARVKIKCSKTSVFNEYSFPIDRRSFAVITACFAQENLRAVIWRSGCLVPAHNAIEPCAVHGQSQDPTCRNRPEEKGHTLLITRGEQLFIFGNKDMNGCICPSPSRWSVGPESRTKKLEGLMRQPRSICARLRVNCRTIVHLSMLFGTLLMGSPVRWKAH